MSAIVVTKKILFDHKLKGQSGEGEAQNCSQRANMVEIHSGLNQAIVIN